jgi:hypothetical protein
VTRASHYGKQRQVSDFFDVSVKVRHQSGLHVTAGVDTGRTVTDNCFVVDSPQQLLNCDVVNPWEAQTQVKLNGTYPLPAGFMISGIFQNTGGPPITATYNVLNALIAPSLGRNLAACGTRTTCTSTAAVPLIPPNTLFEDRRTQLDLRLSKTFRLTGRVRLKANLDVYNVLNASSVMAINTTYGPNWLRPVADSYTGGAVLDGRLFEIGGRLTF